jgi:hypothetical protein
MVQYLEPVDVDHGEANAASRSDAVSLFQFIGRTAIALA